MHWVLMCLLVPFLDLSIQVETGSSRKKDRICNRKFFNEFYVKTGERNFTPRDIARCSLNDTCNKPQLSYRLAQNSVAYFFLVYASQLTAQNNSDCWGYYYEVASKDGQYFHQVYFNFDSQKKKTTHVTYFQSKPTYYTISVTSIPSGRVTHIGFEGTDDCQNGIISLIESKKQSLAKCAALSTHPSQMQLATRVCKMNEKNFTRRHEAVDYVLSILNNTCDLNEAIVQLNVAYMTDTTIDFQCNKTWFMRTYVSKGKPFHVNRYNYYHIRAMCKKGCEEANLWVTYAYNGTNHLFLAQAVSMNDASNSECWGYLLSITEKMTNKSTYIYINFGDMKNDTYVEYLLVANYSIKLLAIPSMKEQSLKMPAPNPCETVVLDEVNSKLHGINCKEIGYLKVLKHFATPICKASNGDFRKAKQRVDEHFEADITPCFLLYHHQKQKTNSILTPLIKAVISSTASIVILVILLVVIRGFRNRRTAKRSMKKDNGRDNLVSLRDVRRGSSIPSVMILSRPGCELLEILLRDLACILNSYCIEVKLALLDQNEIDAEGGISSYMQRNLDRCDYILIMFTENTKENALPKHKPYEFALRVISGLAYHTNSCSQYIPIYLTSYNEAVFLLPSFLNASSSFGYRIPKDISKLLCRVLSIEKLAHSTERQAKDNFFIDRMKSTAKLIVESHHAACCTNNCTKGQLYDSISDLSSIWPSTINSKYTGSPLHVPDDSSSIFNTVVNNNGVVNSMLNTFSKIGHSNISVTQIVSNHINYPIQYKRAHSFEI